MEDRIPENKSLKLVTNSKEEIIILKWSLCYGLLIFSLIALALMGYKIFYILYTFYVLIISFFVIYIYRLHQKHYQTMEAKTIEKKYEIPLLKFVKLYNFLLIWLILMFTNTIIAGALYASGEFFLSLIVSFLLIAIFSTIIVVADLTDGKKLSTKHILFVFLINTIALAYLYTNQFKFFIEFIQNRF